MKPVVQISHWIRTQVALRPWLRLLPMWLLVFSPAIWMAEFVLETAVDVPCFDDWENVPMLKKWQDGTLGFADLWSLQIQHRPVIPRLWVIFMTWIGHGDMRWQNGTSIALNVAASLLVVALLRRTLKQSHWLMPLAFLANCLLFSPILYQNFFWATLFWMAIPGVCMLGALVWLGSSRPAPIRFAGAALIALVATLSFSHGLVLWPVLGVYLLLDSRLGHLKQRAVYFLGWLIIAAFVFAAYFHDFRNQSFHAYELQVGDYALGHTPDLKNWENFSRVIRFSWGLIGNGLARTAFDSELLVIRSEIFGGVLFVAFCICACLCVFTSRGRSLWSQVLPWLALASYGIGMALAVSIGRAHLGEHRCTVPRYFVGTLYVTISTLVLGFLLLRKFAPYSSSLWNWAQRARYLGVAVVTALVVWQWPLWQYGLHLAHVWTNARHQAAGVLTFINHPELAPWSINTLDNTAEYCRRQANSLNDMGLLRTPLAKSTDIHQFKESETKLTSSRADVDEVYWKEGELILKGHARFGRTRPADIVMITVERHDDIVGLGLPRPRPQFRLFNVDYEFTNFLAVPLQDASYWEAHIPMGSLPTNLVSLEVWALDSLQHKVARFPEKIKVPRRPMPM